MEAVNKFLTGYSYGIESSFVTSIVLIIVLLYTIKDWWFIVYKNSKLLKLEDPWIKNKEIFKIK